MTQTTKHRGAGRELDAEVEEIVFHREVEWLPTALSPSDPHSADHERAWGATRVPSYSTEHAAAWQLVERLAPTWTVVVSYTPQQTTVTLSAPNTSREVEAVGRTFPLAMCFAALKAVEEARV